MVGRRGATDMMYEVIISLILLALFQYTVLSYINNHADGASYQAKFYAADIATSADVVNAGYGDVILRYDNIKNGMQHTFWITKNSVSVGKTGTDKTSAPGLGYFGQATRFDGDDTIISPTYMVLRKADGFSITPYEKVIAACPNLAIKQVPLASAVLYVDGTDSVKQAVAAGLKGGLITVTDKADQATIHVTVRRQTGDKNTISFAPTSPDGAAFACFFQQQIAAISTADFTTTTPAVSGTGFDVIITITTKSDTTLLDEKIGQSIANALAVFYRGGQ